MMDPINIVITGVGGQGNVLASQILGRAALQQGFKTTIGETFGLSQRGGGVMSHIRLSEKNNYGPLIPPNMAHVIVGLEPLEALRVLPEYGNEDTLFVVNARPIYPLNVIAGDVKYPDPKWIRQILIESGKRVFWLEATQLALELGGPIMLNMIMLGALCALPDFPVGGNDIKNVLKDVFSQSKVGQNSKAVDVGGDLIQRHED